MGVTRARVGNSFCTRMSRSAINDQSIFLYACMHHASCINFNMYTCQKVPPLGDDDVVAVTGITYCVLSSLSLLFSCHLPFPGERNFRIRRENRNDDAVVVCLCYLSFCK